LKVIQCQNRPRVTRAHAQRQLEATGSLGPPRVLALQAGEEARRYSEQAVVARLGPGQHAVAFGLLWRDPPTHGPGACGLAEGGAGADGVALALTALFEPEEPQGPVLVCGEPYFDGLCHDWALEHFMQWCAQDRRRWRVAGVGLT
jgi:hypothetical protein